ncbi:Trk-type K+ transport system membrane component [Algoriphagus sp. 4150]|uniref:TrkH family potassium uptake protein n=1 Tax=Algoriphagus sp. 4150 TaxID=2817756 RepID=UPI002862D967|nr:potassium transporter TrkG [Algoriphagus sp. 4150]MDR7128509.1 Trk-type K+ transport system membrane component [Algoriphagus sp. 4150]
MNFKLKIFSNPDRNIIFLKKVVKIQEKVVQISSFLAFGILLFHLGYSIDPQDQVATSMLFNTFLMLIGMGYFMRVLLMEKSFIPARVILELLLSAVLICTALIRWNVLGDEPTQLILEFTGNYHLVNGLVIILFFIELSKFSLTVNELKLSPSLVFILSFILLILVGAGLLSLPEASTAHISFIDALFTSTSAVCVTGLIVLDTAKDFTFFGQVVIMILFQIGGLGIMVFTSFFGFFFKGIYSIENRLFIRDYINENNVNEIYTTLFKIISFTVLVEGVCAFMVYHFTDAAQFAGRGDHFFFSLFHAISAFCNAGFSTLSSGLYEEGFREAYHMHLAIAFAIVLGGIGFPVVLNYYSYLKHVIVGSGKRMLGIEKYRHSPRVSSVNTRLVVYTTGILLIIGMVVYAIAEQDATLKGLSPYGKFVTTVFGAVTPRTAGFNTVDMRELAVPTILVYLFLMWIGASPGSTGGGLKTSTFAVAMLNTFSIASGKTRVEVFRRQLTNETLKKAFAVISLSVLVIGIGVFLLMIFNPELALMDVAFEVFSAFSTVGLSLGITSQLSMGSKIVLMAIMLIGRVGTLTMLVAIVRKIGEQRYKYPEETVFIT